jgi:FAD/FMN-containing dehydrogenase
MRSASPRPSPRKREPAASGPHLHLLDSLAPLVGGANLKRLGAELEGDLVTPGDAGWDVARQAWNLAADQHPAAVAIVAGSDDVAAVVAFAGEHDLGIAVQATGHGAVPLGALEGVLLVKTDRLNIVEVDSEAQRARVGAGVMMRDLVDAAQPHALSGLPGSSPDVGVVGYTLGGGLGWLGRRFGLACNHVQAIELVTADGASRRVDAESEADLFWALRGGGGNFGIVTALETALLPVAEVYAGSLVLPAEDGREVFQRYREWSATVPDELTSIARFLRLPPLEEIPEPLRERPLITLGACFVGDTSDGAELIAPLRELGEPIMDTFATIPASQLVTIHMDPEHPVPGLGNHALVGELTAETVDAFVDAAGPDSGSPLLLAELRHAAGALAESAADAGAQPCIDAAFVLNAIGSPMDPGEAEAIDRHLDVVCDAVEPWTTGGCYLNFAERRADVESLFPPDTRRRLSAVKERWDPQGLFRANYALPAT